MSERAPVKEEPAWEAEGAGAGAGALWAALSAAAGHDVKREIELTHDMIYAEDVGFTLPVASDPETETNIELPDTEAAQEPWEAAPHSYPEEPKASETPHIDNKPIVTKPWKVKLEHTDHVKTYECPICHKRTKREIRRHILTHTQEEIDTIKIVKKTGNGKFKCHICGVRLICRSNLVRHLNNHAYATLDPFQEQLRRKIPKGKYIKNNYECDVCGKQTTRKESLAQHLVRHRDEEPVMCRHCNEPFKYAWELMDHIKLGICKENVRATQNVSIRIPEDIKLRDCFIRLKRLSNLHEGNALKSSENIPEISSENELSEENNTFNKEQSALETDEETYYCGICEEQFETLSSIGDHDCVRPKKPVSCDICRKRFKFHADLIVHTRLHTGEKPFICDVCKKQFRLKNSMRMHIRTMHLGENPLSCKICKEKFRTSFSLRKHVRGHTGEKEKKLYSCKVCKKKFRLERECVEHGMVHTGEKPFSCKVCNMEFRLEVYLRYHSRIHTGEKPYSCEVCKRSFRIWQTLDAHKRVHTGAKPFTCDICKKQFRRLDTLLTHKRVHTGEKPYACESCPKRFKQKGHLNIHKKTHTGEKPFSCTVCGKRFSERGKLKQHNRVHTGEKPYSCDVCEKAFSTPSAFREHKRLHTGVKAFACDVCNKCFARKDHVKEHMRSHTKDWPYSCGVCQRRFQRRDYLRLHKRVHRPKSQDHVCDVCGAGFGSEQLLNVHLRHHDVE